MNILGFNIERSKRGGLTPQEIRNYSLKDIQTLYGVLPGLFGGTLSGVNVTADSSMSLPAVFSAVRVISEDLASVPMEVVRTKSGNKSKVFDHYLYDLVHNRPNHYQTPFTFYDNMVAMANLWGNSYAKIHRDTLGRPAEFEIIHPATCTHHLVKRKLWYRIQGESDLISSDDIIHFCGPSYDGIAGVSMIQLHRETIGTGIATRDYGSTFFKNGASLNGLLTSDQRLDDGQVKQYSKNWNEKYTGGPDKAHQTAVLGSGLKYQAIGIPPADAQFVEKSKLTRSEIGGIFRVAAHKMNDLEKATFSNIEHLSIEHVSNTIRPWAKRFEQELNRKLIPERDRLTLGFKFNLNALMRGDSTSRMAFYKGMKDISAYSANDILAFEGENGYEGGDKKFAPLNYWPIDRMDEYIDAKINSLNAKTQNDGTQK